MADDVILIAHTAEEMHLLLDVFSKWAKENILEWKPSKFTVVIDVPSILTPQLKLSGQTLKVSTEAQYLGLTITLVGFRKKASDELEKKARVAFSTITSQSFFDPEIPNSTLLMLYRTNVRSVLMYCTPFTINVEEVEKLDTKVLQQ